VVDACWSVILVGVPDYRVVPNDLNRYNFNTYSPLARDPDGSLQIAIGPSPVRGGGRPQLAALSRRQAPLPDPPGFRLDQSVAVPRLCGHSEGAGASVRS